MLNVTLTQEIYKKSRSLAVQAMMDMPDPIERATKAAELMAAGTILCKEIDIWGMDAAKMMFTWAQLGLPWVPNASQPGLVNVAHLGSTTPTDLSNPWPGSITVSVDAKDYPAHDPVIVPAKEPMVGTPYGDGTWSDTSTSLDAYARGTLRNGDQVQENGKNWVFHVLPGAWFPRLWFTEAA